MFKTLFFLCFFSFAYCEEEPDVAKVSEAMGHLIGKNLQALGLHVDMNAVVKGMQDASQGKSSPLTEDECVQAIALLQEESIHAISEKNLQEAKVFLEKNGKDSDVVSLEDGKLQYRIEKKGEGASVQSYNSPVVEYSASYLNGTIFGSSEGSELLSLDEAIPGFTKGIVGMQEGEVRKLYIHPDLGYGGQGQLSPNSLLIFEVKVIKADASTDVTSNSDQIPKNLVVEEPR